MYVCRCCINGVMYEVKGLSYSFQKAPRGSPGLTFPIDGRNATDYTYAFSSYALRRDLGFNLAILERTRDCCVQSSNSAIAPQRRSL